MPNFENCNLSDPILLHIRKESINLKEDQTVSEALEFFHSQRVTKQIIYFYVTDEKSKLVGVVPTRGLLMNPPAVKISSIMIRDVLTLPSSANVADACELFYKHKFLALPVVADDGRLEGIVDIAHFTDAIIDVNRRGSHDDIFQLIGVHLAAAQKKSPFLAFKNRFPWLVCNMIGGLLCAFVLSRYEHLLDYVIILALYIPVVLALSESVSMQSMTITLQRLHKDTVNLKYFIIAIRNEFVTAFLLGAGSGGIVGLTAWLWKGNVDAAFAMAYSILFAIMTACVIGVVIPIAVKRFSKDPKLASGPIILSIADVLTLLLYFNIAALMIK
jgi:magnesium transporter